MKNEILSQDEWLAKNKFMIDNMSEVKKLRNKYNAYNSMYRAYLEAQATEFLNKSINVEASARSAIQSAMFRNRFLKKAVMMAMHGSKSRVHRIIGAIYKAV